MDYEYIQRLYDTERISLRKIAKKMNIDPNKLFRASKKGYIKLRSKSETCTIAQTGRYHSKETKEKMSKSQKQFIIDNPHIIPFMRIPEEERRIHTEELYNQCSQCKKVLPSTEYYKPGRKKCKSCDCQDAKQRYYDKRAAMARIKLDIVNDSLLSPSPDKDAIVRQKMLLHQLQIIKRKEELRKHYETVYNARITHNIINSLMSKARHKTQLGLKNCNIRTVDFEKHQVVLEFDKTSDNYKTIMDTSAHLKTLFDCLVHDGCLVMEPDKLVVVCHWQKYDPVFLLKDYSEIEMDAAQALYFKDGGIINLAGFLFVVCLAKKTIQCVISHVVEPY